MARTPFLAMFFWLAVLTASHAEAWVVAHVNQPANYTADSRVWTALTPGMEVPEGSWIHTGPRGMAMLRRQAESIVFKPDTLASIRSGGPESSLTNIGQMYGL